MSDKSPIEHYQSFVAMPVTLSVRMHSDACVTRRAISASSTFAKCPSQKSGMSVRTRLAVFALVLGIVGCSDLATEPKRTQAPISAKIVPGDVSPGDTMLKYLTAGMDYKVGSYGNSVDYVMAMIDSMDNGSMRAYMLGSSQSMMVSSTPAQSFSASPSAVVFNRCCSIVAWNRLLGTWLTKATALVVRHTRLIVRI